MRIIAGSFRGRALKGPEGGRARPTSDRVREAIFSLLGGRIVGAEVLDLCCGSGALGIEALSRGALRARFVDIDGRALATTRTNLELCRAEAGAWSLHRGDAAEWLGRWRRWRGEGRLVVLADPPYGHDLARVLIVSLANLPTDAGLLAGVVEHEKDVADTAAGVTMPKGLRLRHKSYGRSALSIVEVDDDE